MFRAALFMKAANQKHYPCPQTVGWMSKTMEYFPAVKINE